MHSSMDEGLRTAILANLAENNHRDFNHLRVGVLHGIAHLAGAVESLEIRSEAEDVVRAVPGVRGVVNRIEAPGAPSPSRIVNLNLKKEATE